MPRARPGARPPVDGAAAPADSLPAAPASAPSEVEDLVELGAQLDPYGYVHRVLAGWQEPSELRCPVCGAVAPSEDPYAAREKLAGHRRIAHPSST